MAPLVGALPAEVVVMETLTANLHLMMASFYRPTKDRYKIVLEGKAFPSDHVSISKLLLFRHSLTSFLQYAVESQIRHHGYDPKKAVVLIKPDDPESATISTSHILSIIEEHASSTAMILLPGVQYYTGQYLDIKRITAQAHSLSILIGWDLAHAVGNVDLHLSEWNVDFGAWCNYKYVNSGPGAIGGLFVNSRHSDVDLSAMKRGDEGYRPRLAGWWGGDKAVRFEMGNGR